MISVAIVFASLLAAASALDVPITWAIPESMMPYPTTFIQMGDSVTFDWQGLHGVYLLSGDECPATFLTTQPPVLAAVAPGGSYTWQATAPGTYNIACQVGDHCVDGMRIQIVVGSGPALAPDAMAPMVPSMAPMAMGDNEGSEGMSG